MARDDAKRAERAGWKVGRAAVVAATVLTGSIWLGAARAEAATVVVQTQAEQEARATLEVREVQEALREAQEAARQAQAGQRTRLGALARDLAHVRQALREASALEALDGRRMAAEFERSATRAARMARAVEASRAVSALHGVRPEAPAPRIPAAWLAQDPADSLYRAARELLAAGRYERAARAFAEIRERFPRSGYVADSYYFQALALERAGGSRNLAEAIELLEVQSRQHPRATTAEDARALQVRIEGGLARRGDARSAARIQARASAECEGDEQELRSAALGALLQMDAERALPILREVLRSRDECSAELRKQAVFLVSQKMTPETVDILLDLAHENPDPDPDVREAAVFWLSQVPSEEALVALESILASSDDPEIQEKALFALSQHRNARAARILREFSMRPDAPSELRENAIFWLGQSPRAEDRSYLRELYPTLDDTELKEKVVFGVAQNATEEDREWLLARALDQEETLEIRKNALFWAGQMGEVDVADLVRLYRSVPDREMREQVIFVLAQRTRDEEAVAAMMEIAESEEDAELRQNAIFWLGQSDDPRVPDFLLRLLRGGGGEG